MSFTDFVKPYPNGYEDGESGDTPVTAAILNTNYDGFLLALNTWAAGMETSLNQKADSSSVGQAISSISGQLVNMQDAINQKSTVSLSDLLSTGTLIGTMVINGVTYNLYAPSGGSGGSSVEWEQIQLTGTKIAEVTIDGVTTDIYAPSGGSGGSGHTILDDDGTALAQEDDLQFNGVYSTDNSEDGVTEVNVYREMTKAEFDLLSSDEKKGFIRVTDEPDIASIVDGVFIDTDNLISSGTLSNSGTTSYTATEDCYFVAYASSGNALSYLINNVTMIFAPTNQTHSLLLKKGQTLTIGEASTYSISYKIYGIQQGSKTVDYHEYSTEEKVVGKWIDGKSVYEKTFDLGSDLLVSTSSWTTLGITLDADKIIETKTTASSGSFQGNILVYNDNGTWKGRTPRNGNDPSYVKYLTIRYTKSS